ncbi:uridine kinase [Streptomyces sp. NPDC059611]|uniref:uridine kinase family protein n=1 Tax=Streptomyces sp. NPDC059611 TaxID=3346884 RepID=UPI003695F9BB
MHPDAPPRNLLALAGGAGSGKTTLAESFAATRPNTVLLRLDRFFHTETDRAPTVPNLAGTGCVVDFSDPRSIDWGRVQQAIGATPSDQLLVVEGTFALEEQIRRIARWTVYLDTPDDLRLARKTLRKIDEGADPRTSLLGYVARGRAGHGEHVAPIQHRADHVLDGTLSAEELADQLADMLAQATAPAR